MEVYQMLWERPEAALEAVFDDPWFAALAAAEHELSCATFDFYRGKGMQTLHLPVTTGSISSPMGLGSDSTPVKIQLFGQPVYLADSMQFFLEFGCRLMPKGCFYIMPSFRGEAADQRHLCQFYHSEAEIPGTFADVKVLAEEYIRHLAAHFLAHFGDTIHTHAGSCRHIERLLALGKFPSVPYREAVSRLREIPGCLTPSPCGAPSITARGERALLEQFGGIVWLEEIDQRLVPFYQATDGHGGAICGDLLFGPGEAVGAGQRCASGEAVKEALKAHEVSGEDYAWYIRMKECRPMQTSGFGMGTERFLMWLFCGQDIRKFQLVPRINGRREYL